MVHQLSLLDIMVLAGEDVSSLPKDLTIFTQKFTMTSEAIRATGYASSVGPNK